MVDRHPAFVSSWNIGPVRLTALLDNNTIWTWWNTYTFYVWYHCQVTAWHELIVSEWQKEYPTVASHLTNMELGKV